MFAFWSLPLVIALSYPPLLAAYANAFYAEWSTKQPLLMGTRKEAKFFIKEKGGKAAQLDLNGDSQELVHKNEKKARVSETAWIANFDEIYAWIDAHLKAGLPVVVSCKGGCVHSGALAIAFVMRKEGSSLKDAYEQVIEVRPCAEELYKPYKSNVGVLDALKAFVKTIKPEKIKPETNREEL
mmetsp:Transcript_38011/g.60233  ORF Transcript_38011/g.60233 Transcript_38011/m.60233 type:complete len:183 (+) Transcript_38011:51-599(+)